MRNVFKKIKRKVLEKFKRGFTLVELLAVIVILAIIMIIAIPAVLNTMEVARRKTFAEYVDKVVGLTEQKELSNELLQNTSSGECTIYDITKDLDLSSTGDYKGYTLVKKANGTKEYVVMLWDKEFMLRPYNYTNKLNYSKESKELSDAIEKYNESFDEELKTSKLCEYGCKECITQSSETIKGSDNSIYNVIKETAKEGTYVREYTGPHQDNMDRSLSTEKIYYWNGSNSNYNEILEKNNVLFAGFCWQIVRTTDTGGIKMIYNGQSEDNKCLSTRTERTIGKAIFNNDNSSPADLGYMYNIRYTYHQKDMTSSSIDIKYSKSFTWDGSKYTLNDENSITFSDISNSNNSTGLNNAHYTCFNASGECTILSYLYYLRSGNGYYFLHYINLTNGKSIEDAINEMLYNDDVNKYDSRIKSFIDRWYENNLASYSDYLEDTIFCNDRSQLNSSTNGWNPNGGSLRTMMYFKNGSFKSNDLSCVNETDKFSTLNYKAKLKYKIGLMSKTEMDLINSNILRRANYRYWLISPGIFSWDSAFGSVVADNGEVYYSSRHTLDVLGVRPAVSLASGTEFIGGDGSTANPYVVG